MNCHQILKFLELSDFTEVEKKMYRHVCQEVCEELTRGLMELDSILMKNRSGELRLIGFRERSMVTLFGILIIKRRLYRKADGTYIFLLDDLLGLRTGERVSDNVKEMIRDLSQKISYREVSKVLEQFVPSHVAHQTVHRVVKEKVKEA